MLKQGVLSPVSREKSSEVFNASFALCNTQEPEMKISTLLDDPKRGVYGRIGVQLF